MPGQEREDRPHRHKNCRIAAREVPVAVVDSLKLAAVDGDARHRKQSQLAAQVNEEGNNSVDLCR